LDFGLGLGVGSGFRFSGSFFIIGLTIAFLGADKILTATKVDGLCLVGNVVRDNPLSIPNSTAWIENDTNSATIKTMLIFRFNSNPICQD